MIDSTCLNLMKSVANAQKDLVVIFNDDEILLSNKAFNKFFGVSSLEEYKESFGAFVDNFVPHPSYFNKEKILQGESWFDGVMKLDEMDRVVSMLSQKYEPQAFSVAVDSSVVEYKIVTLEDITQTLIKRIMIENNATLDKKSGAYAKQYFLQIMKSYEDAAAFNEKIIGVCSVEILSDSLSDEHVQEFVRNFKSATRQDDMLIRWAKNKFLLAFLVDDEEKANMVIRKLKEMTKSKVISGLDYEFEHTLQKNNESVAKLINGLSN